MNKKTKFLPEEVDIDFCRIAYSELKNCSDQEILSSFEFLGNAEIKFRSLSEFNLLWNSNNLPKKFNFYEYLFLNPDLIGFNEIEALIHFFKFGRFENRTYELPYCKFPVNLAKALNSISKMEFINNKFEINFHEIYSTFEFPGEIPENLNNQNLNKMIVDLLDKFFQEVPSPSVVRAIIEFSQNWSKIFNEIKSLHISIAHFKALEYLNKEKSNTLETIDKYFHVMGNANPFELDKYLPRFSLVGNLSEKIRLLLQKTTLSQIRNLNSLLINFRRNYQVSLICSIYSGDEYIENYLENITSCLSFYKCELIIIDANSPGEESSIIERYQKKFRNIKYIKLEHRVTIYEAWNIGIENSSGSYLSSANLDDRRSINYLRRYMQSLDLNPDIDIVYGNMYYALKPNLPNYISKKVGLKTDLPKISTHNLLEFTSPNCAPMWRRDLHARVGMFDARFRVAGDLEFWLRCASSEIKFGFIKDSLIYYYLNPYGLSTENGTHGHAELIPIRKKYINLLIDKERFIARQI